MSFLDKAKDLANQAKDKAGELAEKAGPNATKGLDAAKTKLDKATGGKYHDQIENVSSKVEGVLNKQQSTGDSGSTGGGSTSSGSTGPGSTGPGSTGPGSTGQPGETAHKPDGDGPAQPGGTSSS
ncbi:antitoxin [Saccharopolyspora sp. NPDC047091]|uniref:antitoxin n=1 Tax=Saccharopolyspora sp. NPDC047091 TaxID=3155924 RepID=UPI0033F21F75